MDFHLLVVGSGEAEKGFTELIHKLEIGDRVHLPGAVSDRDYLKNIYTRASLFVFPSLYDNSPIVVKEAAACRCPSLVIRDSNSAEGIEDDRNGFLCENDPAAIASRVQSLFTNREHLSEVGRRAQETLYVPWENIMGKVYARYGELIAEKAGRTVSRHKLRQPAEKGDGA